MGRLTPWVLAAACALAGGGVWIYRARQVSAAPTRSAAALVQSAWTVGRRVALEGSQETFTQGVGPIKAEVVASDDGRTRIRFIGPPVDGATIWEDTHRIFRYNPKRQRLTVASRRAEETPEEQGRLLRENYSARIAGKARVAGRPAVLVELHPKSGHGHWKRVWVDPETSFILASEDRTEDQKVLRSSRFTRIRYLGPGEVPPAATFQPPDELVRKYGAALAGDTSSRFTPQQLSQLLGFKIREPRWLPRGYTFRGAFQTPCFCSRRHQAARLEYSDGLNTITLFECGHPQCTSRENCFSEDGKAGVGFHHRQGDYSYLAIGDAPEKDLQRMVRSASDL
ncbi:MAG TPA: sigma-E factor regulatory protein RseB domain-containing protein [Armatimonadota bacterium]|nr:sigma-E factor regulatory protein RseB domain-containing protein [Armatimonadota bacterium]